MMKCKYNRVHIDWVPVLEGTNRSEDYDIVCSAKELIKQCLNCDDKCWEQYNHVRHLDSNKLDD